jgi:serine phosphatase RsbU (regulator of sigma subunit)/putative methionine-R-sulfoxide reductase with GAF domain
LGGTQNQDDARGTNDAELLGKRWRQVLQLGEQLLSARLEDAADVSAYPGTIRATREMIENTAEQLFGGHAQLWLSSWLRLESGHIKKTPGAKESDWFPNGTGSPQSETPIDGDSLAYKPTHPLLRQSLETRRVCYYSTDQAGESSAGEHPIQEGRPGEGVANEIALPLQADELDPSGEPLVMGLLGVKRPQGMAFSQPDLDLLDGLALQARIALQTVRLLIREVERIDQYSTIFEVSKAISSILDQEKLLDQVVELIHNRFDYPYVHLFSVHPGRRKIFYEAGSGERSHMLREAQFTCDLDESEGIIAWVGRHGQTVLANDVAMDPRYRPTAFPPDDTRSEISLPLIFGGEVLGILDIQSNQLNAFSEQDRFQLEVLADIIAIALRNAYLYRSEHWRRQVADSLREVAGLLSAETGLDQILNAILVELERNLPCDLAAIWLLDETGANESHGEGIAPLRLAAAQGLSALVMDLDVGLRLEEILGQNSPSTGGAEDELSASWLINSLVSEKPLIRSPRSSTDALGLAVGFSSDYSAIAAPLNVSSQMQGLLTLFHHATGRYGKEARMMTATFASYAAVAIENTRLYEAAHEQAWISTVMLQVAEATQNVSDLEELLATIVHITPTVAGVRACMLYLREEEHGFIPATSFGLSPEQELEFERCRFSRADTPAFDRLMEDRGPAILDEGTEDWRLASILYVGLDADNLFADELLILIPLLAREDVLGAFLITYSVDLFEREDERSLEPFFEQQLPIIQGIAHQAAVAIENTRLLRAQKEEAYVSVALLQVAQAVVSKMDLVDIMETIVRITPILVGVKRSVIYLYDAKSAVYQMSQAYGLPREVEGYQFVDEEFPLLDAVREGNRLLALPAITDWDETEDIQDAWARLPVPGPDEVEESLASDAPLVVAFPLSVQDEVLGVLLIEEPDPVPVHVLAGESSQRRLRAKRLEITTGISQQASLAIQNARLQQAMVDRGRLERELQLARDIQRTFLPHDLPDLPGWEISVRWQPAREVGGDFYDYFMLPGNRFGIVIADVADKGMPAALYMTLIRTLIRATLYEVDSPSEVLARVNDVLEAENEQGMFVTLFYGVMSLESGLLAYTNAGHNPPYWLKHRSGELQPLLKGGMALGVLPGNRVEERLITLEPGDYLILYTDGVTEAFSEGGEFYGDERLHKTILDTVVGASNAARDLPVLDVVDAIDDSVSSFIESDTRSDDLTLVVIKRKVTQ